jgi:hypothetical protein
MVAYSFKAMFANQIASGMKSQTVRAERRRHARPGEALQLFTGMRTKACRKILTPDPVCVRIRHIEIVTSAMIEDGIVSISLARRPLNRLMIEIFASADGFSPALVNDALSGMSGRSARANMGAFWLDAHGEGRFEGVLIEWSFETRPADAPQDEGARSA